MQIPGLPYEKRNSVRFRIRLRLRYSLYENMRKRTPSFHGVGQADQETKDGITIDISTSGVVFESKHKPDLDKLCRIEILLPEGGNIRALGKITKADEDEVDSPGKKFNKVHVKFTRITQSNIDKICMWYYKNRFLSDFSRQSLERRKSKRFKVKQARLRYRKRSLLNWSSWNTAYIFEIAPYGVLFKTKEEGLKVNTPLVVEMCFPAYNNLIKGIGKVARVNKNRLEFVNEVALYLYKLKQDDREKMKEHNYLEALVDKSDTSLTWF